MAFSCKRKMCIRSDDDTDNSEEVFVTKKCKSEDNLNLKLSDSDEEASNKFLVATASDPKKYGEVKSDSEIEVFAVVLGDSAFESQCKDDVQFLKIERPPKRKFTGSKKIVCQKGKQCRGRSRSCDDQMSNSGLNRSVLRAQVNSRQAEGNVHEIYNEDGQNQLGDEKCREIYDAVWLGVFSCFVCTLNFIIELTDV